MGCRMNRVAAGYVPERPKNDH